MELGKIYTGMNLRSFAIVNEADDDKYVHIGYGKYKEKGHENDQNSSTYTKDDNGNYIPTDKGNDSSNKPDVPTVNIFNRPKSKQKTTKTVKTQSKPTAKKDSPSESFNRFDKMMNIEGGGFNKDIATSWFGRYDSDLSKLDKKEHVALDKYRDIYYTAINKLARGDVRQSWLDSNKKKVKELNAISDSISKSISKISTHEDIVSYRGVDGSRNEKVAEFFNNLKVGDEYEDSGFSSTSINRDIVEGKFTATQGKGANIKIMIPKGSHVLPMQNIGSTSTKQMYDDEYEVLLDKNSKFKVLNKDGINITVMLIQ